MYTDISVFVVNHKPFEHKYSKPYTPLLVGATPDAEYTNINTQDTRPDSDGIYKDNTGQTIWYKNPVYCELTALYWIWKNCKSDIKGLVHYRRFLTLESVKESQDSTTATGNPQDILTEEQIKTDLLKYDALAPTPVAFSKTVLQQYSNMHPIGFLQTVEKLLKTQSPKYYNAYKQLMTQDKLMPYNIFIATAPVFDAYCEWLFAFLDECEKLINPFNGLNAYQRRAFGFLAERLFNVWSLANDISIKHCPVTTSEGAKEAGDVLTLSNDKTAQPEMPDTLEELYKLHKLRPFDAKYYYDNNADLQNAFEYSEEILKNHFINFGLAEGRTGSSFEIAGSDFLNFLNLSPSLRDTTSLNDPQLVQVYLSMDQTRNGELFSNLRILGLTQNKTMKKGWQCLDFSKVYDYVYYTEKYDDAPADYWQTSKTLEHFLTVGIPEGRQGSAAFNLEKFKKQHNNLTKIFGNDNKMYYIYYILIDSKSITHGIDWRYIKN